MELRRGDANYIIKANRVEELLKHISSAAEPDLPIDTKIVENDEKSVKSDMAFFKPCDVVLIRDSLERGEFYGSNPVQSRPYKKTKPSRTESRDQSSPPKKRCSNNHVPIPLTEEQAKKHIVDEHHFIDGPLCTGDYPSVNEDEVVPILLSGDGRQSTKKQHFTLLR